MATVKIIKKTAPLGYAYGIGAIAEFPDAQAAEFIERGYAEPLDTEAPSADAEPQTEEVKQATAEKPAEVKKAIKKK